MKLSRLIILPFIFISCCLHAQQSFEGLLYLDHSPVRIETEDGLITRIIRIDSLAEDAGNIYIAPGLIDNQVNGFMGVSFGLGGGDLSPEGVKKATKALWRYGVTTYLPTLTTNAQAILERNFEILAQAIKDPELLGSIAGFHLEGPYISPEDGYRGAHPVQHIRKPDWEEFMRLVNASGGNILQVGVAPEVEGVMDFISKCNEHGIIVSLTHHNASTSEITEAVDRGAQTSTHLGNGLANTINRFRNPLWPQLSEDRLTITMICDGFHLLPEQIRVFYKVKGPAKIILTSDITSFGGLPPGIYVTEQGETIEKTPGGLMVFPAENVLYGSAITLDKGVGHIMKVAGCDLASAIRMASTNSAHLYRLDDRGEIKPGMRADLVLFTMENFEMDILQTIIKGEVVYDSSW
jgi:N-acetylglucosamine-6-phosphate deacetylase